MARKQLVQLAKTMPDAEFARCPVCKRKHEVVYYGGVPTISCPDAVDRHMQELAEYIRQDECKRHKP